MGYLSVHIKTSKLLLGGLIGFGIIIAALIYQPSWFSLSGCRVALWALGMAASVEILCFDLSSRFAPTEAVATVTAFVNCLVMLGGFIMQPLIGVVLDIVNSGRIAKYSTVLIPNGAISAKIGYQIAFTMLPLVIILGLVMVKYLMSQEIGNAKHE